MFLKFVCTLTYVKKKLCQHYMLKTKFLCVIRQPKIGQYGINMQSDMTTIGECVKLYVGLHIYLTFKAIFIVSHRVYIH